MSDALQQGASQFETNAGKLKRKYWWKNCKMMIILAIIILVILIIIIGEYCLLGVLKVQWKYEYLHVLIEQTLKKKKKKKWQNYKLLQNLHLILALLLF